MKSGAGGFGMGLGWDHAPRFTFWSCLVFYGTTLLDYMSSE